MADCPDTKKRRPTDINQLAKSIVDLATGNPIIADPPVDLKSSKARDDKLSTRQRKEAIKKPASLR